MKNPCSIALSLLVLLWPVPAPAADLPLRAFNATYKLYESGMHIANTELSLQLEDELWHWRMQTSARGVFAWFTDKQPFSETVFSHESGEIRLRRIVVNNGPGHKKRESARFDWESGKVEVLRKGKTWELELQQITYDLHSLHLLAAEMGQGNRQHETVYFYNKGKIVRSNFVANGEDSVNVNGESRAAYVYEQRITGSEAKLRYYYDAKNPILPLRIEKIESGESPTIMTLQQVDWTL